MNLSIQAFGRLSDEQKLLIHRAIQIEDEEHALYEEKQSISRELKKQGINLWEEIRYLKSEKKK